MGPWARRHHTQKRPRMLPATASRGLHTSAVNSSSVNSSLVKSSSVNFGALTMQYQLSGTAIAVGVA